MGKVGIYALRQGILRTMRALSGAPVSEGEIRSVSQEAPLRLADDGETREAFRGLAEMGYLEPIAGFGGRYFRISRRGLEQLLPEFPQDAYIWGPGAV